MEKVKVGRDTVVPNDDKAREYVFEKETYLKIYPEGESGGPTLILPAIAGLDFSEFTGAEVGEKYTIEIIELTVVEYALLPEFDGF